MLIPAIQRLKQGGTLKGQFQPGLQRPCLKQNKKSRVWTWSSTPTSGLDFILYLRIVQSCFLMRVYLSSPGYTGTCNPPASSPKYYVLPAFGILCVYACVLEPVMCKPEVDIRCHPGSISTLPVKTWNSPSARLLTRKPQEPYLYLSSTGSRRAFSMGLGSELRSSHLHSKH